MKIKDLLNVQVVLLDKVLEYPTAVLARYDSDLELIIKDDKLVCDAPFSFITFLTNIIFECYINGQSLLSHDLIKSNEFVSNFITPDLVEEITKIWEE